MDPDNTEKVQTKRELFKELDKIKNEVIGLRKELNNLNREKESWFSKKDDFSKQIREKIKNIKENKEKRDTLTKSVKDLKGKRTNLNEEVKGKISNFKKLTGEKNKLLSKSKVRDPSQLKKDIDNLEQKLETEVMPFEKEKQFSKKLKEMKKALSDASDAFGIIDSTRKLNSKISAGKKNTATIHSEIQEKAGASQELHENLIKLSKEIDNLKPKEQESFKKFSELRKKFGKVNKDLKEKLTAMAAIREKINKFTLEEAEKRKLNESMLIQSKEKEIEEKIKSGKKLTTDDFIAFQDMLKKK